MADSNDGYSKELHAFALAEGFASRILFQSDFGKTWRYLASNCAPVIMDGDDSIRLDEDDHVYLLRCPFFSQDGKGAADYLALGSYLSEICSKKGTFLASSVSQSFCNSKPLNLLLHDAFKVPKTVLTTRLQNYRSESASWIIKAIGPNRSEVTTLSDPRLCWPDGMTPGTPSLIQERADGKDLKVTFYRCRNGSWLILPLLLVHKDAMDYRFNPDNLVFERYEHRPNSAWEPFGERIYSITNCRLFDADFIVTEEDLLFLEVNFSPAPLSAELAIPDCDKNFTRRFLKDWLSG